MKIAQLMTRDVHVCHKAEMLDRAVRIMRERDVGAVPIVDDHGQLVGMLTDRDACMAALDRRAPLHELRASDAMSAHVVTCHADDTDYQVAKLMAKHQIRRLPVVDDTQRPCGIVSIDDLALAAARGTDVPATEIAGILAAMHGV